MTDPAAAPPVLEGIAPIVPVRDAAASARFYVEALGFEMRGEGIGYALVGRGDAAVMLLGGADARSLEATANNIAAYVWVKELGGLWEELAPRLADLPEGRVRAPFVQEYGMREFHVKDPDGFLIFFGEAV